MGTVMLLCARSAEAPMLFKQDSVLNVLGSEVTCGLRYGRVELGLFCISGKEKVPNRCSVR